MREGFIYKEDAWSIIIGLFLLIVGFIVFFNSNPENVETQAEIEVELSKESEFSSYKTVKWYEYYDQLKSIKASKTKSGRFLGNITTKPATWKFSPLQSFILTDSEAESKNIKNTQIYNAKREAKESLLSLAITKDANAAQANYANALLNGEADAAINNWRIAEAEYQAAGKKIKNKPYNKVIWLLSFAALLIVLFGSGAKVIQGEFINFAKGFLFVFLIGLISYFLAANEEAKSIGFGYAAWAILIGLLISNTVGTPKWVKPALLTELYIKTGLVVLGAEILLGKILAIGLPGIFVAWIVTPIVLISTFWFGQKVLKIGSKTLNMTISADMSVCGVSAAVAVAAACKATKEELTIAVGLSMVFTSIMMIVLPAFINAMGMPEILGGAWIGGTIDATGAVVAAGAFLGEKALSVAATIKMIQNVLIGIIAFGVAVYFSGESEDGKRVRFSWGEIWRRFPKFILGFLGASVLFSIIYQLMGDNQAYTFIDQGVIGGFTKNIRGWLFCLAFVSIGLSINFKDLRKHFIGGKPFVLYICGQAFNLGLTLLMAYLMFYKVFPAITNSI